jgi:hypothetical protein
MVEKFTGPGFLDGFRNGKFIHMNIYAKMAGFTHTYRAAAEGRSSLAKNTSYEERIYSYVFSEVR